LLLWRSTKPSSAIRYPSPIIHRRQINFIIIIAIIAIIAHLAIIPIIFTAIIVSMII
jgi:hypothetical protein